MEWEMIAKDQLARIERQIQYSKDEAERLEKVAESIRNQLQCEHDWVSDNSGMQFETSQCTKCKATYSV